MKNLLFFTFFVSLFHAILSAQAPDTLWTKTYGGSSSDVGKSVQETSDGGYIITGYTGSYGIGYYDVWLIKTDANGDTLWTKTFGGNGNDLGESVQQTFDGGYIITGYTESFGMGSNDVWLIKTDANGDTLWTKTFGDSSNDVGRSVQQSFDGGYIITGETSSFSPNFWDIWLIKTDSSGDTLWTRTFGGSGDDWGPSVRQTGDGGYVIIGSTLSLSPNGDMWLIRTNVNGDTLWTKTFGGIGNDWGYSGQQTTEKGFIIAGDTDSFGSGLNDIWLIKTDTNGDTLWTKTFGGYDSELAYSVSQTDDNGFIVTGATSSFAIGLWDLWLIKTSPNGYTLWSKTLGGIDLDCGLSVQQSSDSGYIITGYTKSFGAGSDDVWLIKLASDPTGIDETQHAFINDYRLQQNYPNPFNPTTTISYQLPIGSGVELIVYNLLGQQIRTLVNTHQTAGAHQMHWDGQDESGAPVPSGIYFYQLKAGDDFAKTKKMVLLR